MGAISGATGRAGAQPREGAPLGALGDANVAFADGEEEAGDDRGGGDADEDDEVDDAELGERLDDAMKTVVVDRGNARAATGANERLTRVIAPSARERQRRDAQGASA